MTRKNLSYCVLVFATGMLFACNKDKVETDTTYPTIDLGIAGASPVQCAVVERGKPFVFKAKFSDNKALGSYSLDIHHNFDHHTHSTEVKACEEDAVKVPVTPMLYIKDYAIPAGRREFVATTEIDIPAHVDAGDYHFMIRLTDQEGWQTMRGISIKIK